MPGATATPSQPVNRPAPHYRIFAVGMAAAVTAAAAACGIPASAPEGLTRVNVAVVSIADGSTFFVALRHGYFTQVGLDVHYTTTPQSTAAMPALLAGRIDVIGAANYVSAFESQIHGAASIRVLAEDGECGTGTDSVLVLPHSGITAPAGLAGKTVATNITGNIQQLMIDRQLQADDINPATVHFAQIPFPDQITALQAHRVDAINEVEPYVSEAEDKLGAETVLPVCAGPTAGMPLTGWITSASWAAAHPATARAFQRAIQKGGALAATDRAAVEQVLPGFLHIPGQLAAIVNLNTFPSDVDPVHLQRVADLMLAGGVITKPFNVTPLVFR
jgi:NitT/TauT family transport system substrate-binding protein